MRPVPVMVSGALLLALLGPAGAAQRHKRGHSGTGPLIMSSSFGPVAASRRMRAADKCVPVTVKRRPLMSLLKLN